MKTKNLYQKDLAFIFGGRANVSKFLNGERELGKKHISGLKKKFKISSDFFCEISQKLTIQGLTPGQRHLLSFLLNRKIYVV